MLHLGIERAVVKTDHTICLWGYPTGNDLWRQSMRMAVVCTAVIIGMGCSLPSDKQEITALKKKNQELQEKFDSIQMQEKCAKLAEHSFQQVKLGKNDNADYQCHYNTKKNKFLIYITIDSLGSGHTTKMLIDLLENKTIAGYMWGPVKGKKFWEVKPFYCRVNEEPVDWTTEQFTEFVKPYMTE